MELAAYSTAAVTLGLVVTRPRLSPGLRISPAMAALAGVLVMLALGIVEPGHLGDAALDLWSPFVAIAAIMVMTEVASRVGLLALWAERIDRIAGSASRLFALVFCLGVLTSASLNNDAAILVLTPLVVALVRRRFPGRPDLVLAFAFAVFVSAGVAPLPVSNPMNMVVADFSGISFNRYALHMLPVAVVGWIVGFALLRWIFRRQLAGGVPVRGDSERPPATAAQRSMMALLAVVLVSYPIAGFAGVPPWSVALFGAISAIAIAARRGESPAAVVFEGISWGTLGFLLCVLIMSIGLFEVGLVDRLTGLYAGAGVWTVGATSTVGSALLNNHPMAQLNMLALESAGAGEVGVLAALVGGDLGPRLLPMGSLAGLLWIELLRRSGVEVTLRQFVTVGVTLTLPTLIASLALLSAF